MKSFIPLLCTLFILQSVNAQNPVPYLKKNGKYIYVDSATMQPSAKFTGEMQEAFIFDKGVAYVKVTNGTVYFNENGAILNTCITKNCNTYYDGFTLLLKKFGNTYCLSNKEGKELTPYKYYEFRGYSEGVFIVKSQYGNYGYVDTSGNEIWGIAGEGFDFKEVLPFKNGFAKVLSIKIGAKEVFINKKGKEITASNYHNMLQDYSEGLAGVYDFDAKGSAWGYMDTTGNIVIPQNYSRAGGFNQGYAVVRALGSKNPKGIVIDKTGKEICNFSYYTESGYYYGIVGVSFTEKDKFVKGFINMKGKLIGKKTFDHFVLPGYGLIAAGYRKPGNPHGYSMQIYNTSLETVSINKLYDDVGMAGSSGMIKVGYEKKYGYINTEGKEIIPLKYDEAKAFQNGYAYVRVADSKWFYIDAAGREYREQ